MFNAPVEQKQNGMMEVAMNRQAQEVQAAMVIAQKFPRDKQRAFQRITEDCKRRSLAERAVYSYPRGNETVYGPSIRLAETIARNWGNIDFGLIELDNKPGVGTQPGESTIMSYCWDLETNVRVTKVFSVKHRRDTKKGSYNITDSRDVYELTANQGARRLRACILGVIPADVVDAAVDECDKTMEGGQGPLIDRVRQMLKVFAEVGVTQEMIEGRLNHRIDITTEAELVGLRKIYNSIRDNFADRSEFFDIPTTSKEPQAQVEVKSVKDLAPQAPKEQPKIAEAPKEAAPVVGEFGEFQSEPITNSKPMRLRKDIIADIGQEAKRLGWTNERLGEFIKEKSGKSSKELPDTDMETVLILMKSEKSK